jgi:hypothetical protein
LPDKTADLRDRLVDGVRSFYLASNDFNGIPGSELAARLSLSSDALAQHLSEAILDDDVSINCWGNIHIKRLPDPDPQTQISALQRGPRNGDFCVYPTTKTMQTVVDPQHYSGRPFTLRLALAEAQLSYLCFDLSILEIYRSDPRYYYQTDDVSGMICIKDEYCTSEHIRDSDKVLLQTFGFCYNEDFNRAVAVFLRYLHDLSPEHQHIWHSRLLESKYELHPDYFRSAILGEFYEGLSIFDAFLAELRVINQMSVAMGRPPLFKEAYEERPRELGFLIRPTQKEFNNFVQLLDKMLSENINRGFFKGDIDFESETARKDGKIVVTQKGTIQLLEEWFRKWFKTSDWEPVEEMIAAFKEVRRLRSKPAHALDDNTFDHAWLKQQREVMMSAYNGVRTIRLAFANHPKAQVCKVADVVQEARIWNY